jgi:hypothetical protein
MMPEALASRLAIDRLQRVGRFHVPRPRAGSAGGPPARIGRLARRIRRRVLLRRPRAARLPPGAFELEARHELTTAQLWGVWTVAHLESGLALRAWRIGPREHRGRAYLAYQGALAREDRAARVLAERACAPASPAPAGA